MRIWLASPPLRAISLGIEPGTRVATARHMAPVMGEARCGWPLEMKRTAISMSAALSSLPDSVVMATGAATMATAGPLSWAAASVSRAMPMATEAARRIASSFCSNGWLASISAGFSVAVRPTEAADTKT